MLAHAIYIAVILAAGFGLGRIKNAGKLAAVKAYLTSAEAKATAEVKTVIADIRSKI
jgi:hypothetical protein